MRHVDRRYIFITVVYVAVIFFLSSLPEFAVRESHPAIRLLSNLVHTPIFAGLAYCVLKMLSGSRSAGREHYALAFGITSGLAVLDEWHQSYVPGRMPSVGDLLLDVAGISLVLLAMRLRAYALQDGYETE